MKLVATFLVIFLAVQTGTARHTAVKRGFFDFDWVDDLVNKIKGLVDDVTKMGKDFFDKCSTDFSKITDSVIKVVKDIENGIHDTIYAASNQIDTLGKDIIAELNTIKNDKLAPLLDDIVAKFGTCKTQIGDIFKEVENIVQTITTEVNDKLQKTIEGASSHITEKLKEVIDCFSKGLNEKWANIEPCIAKFKPEVEEYSAKCLESAKACVVDSAQSIKNMIEDILQLIPEGQSIIEKFVEDVKACKDNSDYTGILPLLTQAAKDVVGLAQKVVTCKVQLEMKAAEIVSEVLICETNVGKDVGLEAAEFIGKFKDCCKQG